MHRTLMNRKFTRRALAIGAVAATGWLAAAPVAAQQAPAATQQPGSRYRVLVPNLEISGGASEKLGKEVAELLRKDIDKLATHQSVDKKELNESLKKFKLKEDELDCIKARQLAVQIGAELVMCGTVNGGQVSASFIGARTGETFEVAPFSAGDATTAEKTIFNSFEKYINQLSFTAFCTDYLASSQWQNAIDNCTKALAVSDQSATALYGRARGYMGLADAAEQAKDSTAAADANRKAYADLKSALAVNPTHQESLRAAGIIAARLGEPEASRKYFEQYLELNPGASAVRLTLANEAAKAGDPEGALKMAEGGISADSSGTDVLTFAGHWALQAAQKAQSAASKGQNSGSGPAPEALPFMQKAVDYYNRAIAKNPKEVDPGVYTNLMIALNQMGRSAEAVEVGAKAVQAVNDKSSIWISYAEALEATGRHADALAALDSAVAKDPQAQRVYVRRGGWELTAGDLAAAKADFQKAIERNELPADDIAKTIFSVGYNEKYKAGKADEALEYFQLVEDIATTAETKGLANFWMGLVWYTRGTNKAKVQTPESAKSAVPDFQKALEFFGDADAYAASNGAVRSQLNQMTSYARTFIDTVRKGTAAQKKKA